MSLAIFVNFVISAAIFLIYCESDDFGEFCKLAISANLVIFCEYGDFGYDDFCEFGDFGIFYDFFMIFSHNMQILKKRHFLVAICDKIETKIDLFSVSL